MDFMNYYRPMQPQMQAYMPKQEIVRVNGIDGAKAYQMQANQTVALFDNNEDIFYIKISDGANFPTIRMFKFEEITNASSQPNCEYISRNEFEQFKKEMMEYGKQFIQPITDLDKQ